MQHILLSCVLTLPQMFKKLFKPREVCNIIQGNSVFHSATCLWCHILFIPTSFYNYRGNTGNIRHQIRQREEGSR